MTKNMASPMELGELESSPDLHAHSPQIEIDLDPLPLSSNVNVERLIRYWCLQFLKINDNVIDDLTCFYKSHAEEFFF